MSERETLLAEIATLEAAQAIMPKSQEIAEGLSNLRAALSVTDKEPDYEAWRPALEAFYDVCPVMSGRGLTHDDDDKQNIRGLIAAFAKAPPMGSGMTEAEIEALARECAIEVYKARGGMDAVRELSSWHGKGWAAYDGALTAIRETISRVHPRWPSEKELRQIWDISAHWLDFARRIRAYQTGEQA